MAGHLTVWSYCILWVYKGLSIPNLSYLNHSQSLTLCIQHSILKNVVNYNANWNMPQHNVCNYLHSYVCQSSKISYCCVSQSMMVAPCRYTVHLWLAFVALWLAYNQPITNQQSQATMDWLSRHWSCMEHIEHFRLSLLWMLSWHIQLCNVSS